MADRTLLRSPFGVFYGGTRPIPPTRINSKKLWRKSAAQTSPKSLQSIYLLDPPAAILRMVEQVCLIDSPTRYYLTCWQAPGGVRHTKLSFLVDTPEEALRLLQTAAQTWEQQAEPVRQ
jgi:hypothetical protein